MSIKILELPQLKIAYEDRMPKKNLHTQETVFLCGGRPPSLEWLATLLNGHRKIWAIDRGIDLCYQMNLAPDFLIGDLDSASQAAIDWVCTKDFRSEMHPRDKDLTDFQLAIKSFTTKFFSPIIITGIFGGRLDMTLSNIFTCAYLRNFVVLSDQYETIFFLKSCEEAQVILNEHFDIVSLIPITENCLGVSIDNVHWKLDGAMLQRKLPSTVSNRLPKNFDPSKKKPISISLLRGTMAVYFGKKLPEF